MGGRSEAGADENVFFHVSQMQQSDPATLVDLQPGDVLRFVRGANNQAAQVVVVQQVRFRRYRLSATGEFWLQGDQGRGRVRIQVHCTSIPLLSRSYC